MFSEIWHLIFLTKCVSNHADHTWIFFLRELKGVAVKRTFLLQNAECNPDCNSIFFFHSSSSARNCYLILFLEKWVALATGVSYNNTNPSYTTWAHAQIWIFFSRKGKSYLMGFNCPKKPPPPTTGHCCIPYLLLDSVVLCRNYQLLRAG